MDSLDKCLLSMSGWELLPVLNASSWFAEKSAPSRVPFAGLAKLCGLCELLAWKSASSEGIRPYRAGPSITSAVNSSAQPQLMVMPAPPCP